MPLWVLRQGSACWARQAPSQNCGVPEEIVCLVYGRMELRTIMARICRACPRICFIKPCTCTLCRGGFCPRCLALKSGDELDRIRLDHMQAAKERDR